ncbi:hypothetical protein IUZ16_002953 [Salmonella enterica]|nr:hypothetical protein [Salmonella enterica]
MTAEIPCSPNIVSDDFIKDSSCDPGPNSVQC